MILRFSRQYPRLCILAAMFTPPTSHAIINVEQAIIGRPADGVHTTLGLLANGARGNTEKSASMVDLLSLWQQGRHTEYLQVQSAYGKSRGQVDTDRAFAHLRHRTDIANDWGVEGFAQTGRDRFARMLQRTLLGGGLRKVLFEEQGKSAGYFGFGAFYERETLRQATGTTDPAHEKLWRANTYLVLKQQLNENVRFYSTTYYQPGIARAFDYRALEQASVLVKLRDNLDLKVSLDISFDSQPPQTVQKRDLFYSTGLEYTF